MKALVAIPLAVAVVLTLFAWPSARLEPADLPIGIAGPAPATQALEKRLSASENAFDLRRYDDAAAARAAIDDREVYGAFVATPAGLTVLTSSAASGAVAQQLTVAAGEAGAVAVEDVRAAPRGAALASSVLPLLIAGILTGAAAALLGTSALSKTGLLLAGSLLSGLVAVAIVQGWLDVVGGDWLANAAVLSLTVLAIGATVAGLHALFGERGAIAGALAMVLIGNPFSGVSSAPELLPQPVGAIGQLLPPGAGGNLLRSTGFFDGAAAGGHVAVLAAWALAGLALVFVAAARARPPSAVPAPAAG
jgi:hypothetical protein